jgi:xylulokinase
LGYAIAYDIGTTGVKTCLFKISKEIELIDGAYGSYNLYILENGGAEQDTEEWWTALCSTTKALLQKTGLSPDEINGISFCSQMQGLVLVDKNGNALRRPMSYMDQRSSDVMKKYSGKGIKVAGLGLIKLLTCLAQTHAAPLSVKDPLWKYLWVKDNEPEVYSKIYKWLDVKEYFICRATGQCVMTKDSAWSTLIYDSNHYCWSKKICRMFKVNPAHLPRVIECYQVSGNLTEKAAAELGLKVGTEVYGGGGDATLIGVGAGCTNVGDTHIYSGTSGWVGTVTDKQLVDASHSIAATMGPVKGRFNYFAEMETAGKCFEWVKEHLALDEIGIYLKKQDVAESKESEYESLYDYLSDTIKRIPAGSNGVVFTPWLHGNRCPFEDPNASGLFFNINIDTGKTQMIRAVLEGICFHLRWMLEVEELKVQTSDVIRFVGGGALSDVTCQILADITGRKIETVEHAQDVGAVGAAMLVGLGCGLIPSIDKVKNFVKVKKIFIPNLANKAVYDRNFKVFKSIYSANKKLFKEINKKGINS